MAEFSATIGLGLNPPGKSRSNVPTALIVAERDAIVPARRSTPLRAAIPNLVFERAIDAGHNDLYDRPAFAEAMRQALATIDKVSGQALE